MNALVQRNRHRWKETVTDLTTRKVLRAFAKHLKWAWETDKEDPKSYPLNTGSVFFDYDKQLARGSRGESQIKPPRETVPPVPPPPKRFSDLVDEKTIKDVFEQQNDGSYNSALKLAMSGDSGADSVWRRILLALDDAHFVKLHGGQVLRQPRVHHLHRSLLEMAKRLGINELTHEGIAEFFDDFCPCGKKHESEAIRKLRKRWSGRGLVRK